MPDRRSHNHDKQKKGVEQPLKVMSAAKNKDLGVVSYHTGGKASETYQDESPYVDSGYSSIQATTSRPRIFNNGHIKIYSDYDGKRDIINGPRGTIELMNAPTKDEYPAVITRPAVPPTSPSPQPQTVARYYCLSCKAKYFTQERLDQHIAEYPNYCGKCGCCRKAHTHTDANYCCWENYSTREPYYWLPGRGGAVIDE